MSLTESRAVFVSAHESSLNDIIHAIVSTRPHLLAYGSSAFVPTSSVGETRMQPIPFPGTGGIEWMVRFKEPQLDLYDEDVPLAPPLTLEKGQWSISTGVELCLDCPRERRGQDPADHPDDRPRDVPKGKAENPVCCFLEIQAVGHLVSTSTTTGERALAFELDALEIIDITPDDLESVLECLMGQILRAVIRQIRLPLNAIRVGAFSLTPTDGPLIELDRVLARGNL